MGAVLLWSTLRAQQAECEVCVTFNGQERCATASANNEEDAWVQAQLAACGPITAGMNESIACQNRMPTSRSCSSR